MGFQAVHGKGDKEVGGFAAAQFGGEVVLDEVLLAAAVGRVHEDDVVAVGVAVVAHVLFERVAVADARAVDVVQDEVGDGEQMRQRFFFDAVEALVQGGAVLYGFDLRLDVV